MPRKKIPIDYKRVDQALMAGCDGTEIAGMLGIHFSTLERAIKRDHNMDFADYKAQKRAKGNALLRQVQYDKAIKGDTSMLVWLGKNRLDQTDKKQVTQDINLGSSFGDLLG